MVLLGIRSEMVNFKLLVRVSYSTFCYLFKFSY